MKKILLYTYALIGIFGLSPGQEEKMYLKSDLEINSNVVTNAMINKILWGDGYIDSELKDNATGRLGSGNRLGFRSIQEFGYRMGLNESKAGEAIVISFSNVDLMNLAFNEDSWQLYWYGNKMFEGESASLSGLHFYNLSYQKLNAVVSKILHPQIKLQYGIGILGVDGFSEFNVMDSYLYTAPYGEYLSSQLNYSEKRQQDGGYDPGVALTLGGTYISSGKDLVLTLKADNIGFFIGNYTERTLDTNLTFEGVQIDNIISPELSSGNLDEDSLLNSILPEFTNGRGGQLLPYEINLKARYHINDKVTASGVINYVHLRNYVPRITLEARYNWSKKLSMSWYNSYGGFGRYNTGLGVAYTFKERFRIGVNSRQLNSLIFPGSSCGMGFGVRVSYQ